MSGWSASTITILAARLVVPPDLIAPAARSPIFRKLISPDERPPPDSLSPSPRRQEKLAQVRPAFGSTDSAPSSAVRRHSQGGTPSSSTAATRAGTPALRKYFCARMSHATWLHSAGTSIPSAANTTDPSGLRISLVALRKATASYGSRPAVVKRRAICIGFPRVFCGGGFGPRIQWLGAMLNPTYSTVKWAIQHVGRCRDLDTICCVIVTRRPHSSPATEGFTRSGSQCNSPRPRDGRN